MNRSAHLLLKTQNTAFRSADAQAYSTARTDLKRGIKRVKHCLQVEDHFSNPDTCGRTSVSSVNTSPPAPPQLPLTHPSSTSLTTSVWEGYPCTCNTGIAGCRPSTTVILHHWCWSSAEPDQRAQFCKPWRHPWTGTQSMHGGTGGELTHLFNLSLTHAVVLTCFKSTAIVSVTKHSTPVCLNDYHPVALTPIISKYLEMLVLAHFKSCPPPTPPPTNFPSARKGIQRK